MKTTKTQATHTPGPWHVGIKQAEQIVYDAKGNAVANATTYYFDSTKELCHANARLIASAPDLLEALKQCHHAMLLTDLSCKHPAFEMAQAAILKATNS